MINLLRKAWFLFPIVILTIVFFAIFASVQQVYRQSANDPQIELADNISRSLATGQKPDAYDYYNGFNYFNKVDLASGVTPFVIIYDNTGKVIAGNGQIDGQTPIVPFGVLENAKEYGENRVTWQPRTDIRIASVVRPYTGSGVEGYVLVGRNLREVEARINKLGDMLFIAWAISVGILFSGLILKSFFFRYD